VPADGIDRVWGAAKDDLAALAMSDARNSDARGEAVERHLVLRDAFERAVQRRLVEDVNTHATPHVNGQRPDMQAVFCTDVRSEVFRRYLEAADPGVDTLGFAGFFGFPITYVLIGHEKGGARCPVLLRPGHTVLETVPDRDRHDEAVARRRLSHHVKRAWTSFKMGAISCFSFAGPVGLAYLPKIITDTLRWTRTVADPDASGLDDATAAAKEPGLESAEHHGHAVGMPLDDRIDTAEGALRAMSLTDGFVPLVVITGRGATTVNNPYDTGLDCGAFGGRSGEANARVAAAVLNAAAVRDGLTECGIEVPDDRFFLACKHDTTTDDIVVLNRGAVPASHRDRLRELEQWLDQAGRRTRAERFPLTPNASVDADIQRRSADWGEVRPEWGLAGCAAFIVAPRHRTEGLDLDGRAFLHSYDCRQDDDFACWSSS